MKNTITHEILKSEVATLNILTRELKLITQVKSATQLLNMDGKIILPLNGKYYLLEGEDTSLSDHLKPYSNPDLPLNEGNTSHENKKK